MKLYVVGFGAGCLENQTIAAQAAIQKSDTIVGYTTYISLLEDRLVGKRCFQTPMRKEADRCRMAIEETLKGHTVSLICSGDSGVYGLAGLVLELAEAYPPFDLEIVSGVTAACSGAAVLGAPLTHDFAVISLSDLLTEWSVIEKRLDCAAQADFVLCLYNPASHRRKEYLRKACDIVLHHRTPETCCGFVRQIGREGQSAAVLTLAELRETEVDMFTTVFIGNSQTKMIGNRLVTPRGYQF